MAENHYRPTFCPATGRRSPHSFVPSAPPYLEHGFDSPSPRLSHFGADVPRFAHSHTWPDHAQQLPPYQAALGIGHPPSVALGDGFIMPGAPGLPLRLGAEAAVAACAPPPSSLAALHAKKGSKVSVACQMCKQKKIKCSGAVPCEPCVKSGTASSCDINEGLDSRRKSTRKRDVEEKNRLEMLLGRVHGLLASAHDSDILALRQIAQGGSRYEFEEHVLHSNRSTAHPSQSPECQSLAEPQAGRTERKRSRSGVEMPRRTAADVAWMCRDPGLAVPAARWSTIVDDELFISHLVSLWLAWHHPVWQWFDIELFLPALTAGDTASPHCSAFLVNCILAEACYFAGDIRSYLVHTDSRSLSKLFYRRAEQLLDQDSRPCLASVQGLGILTGNDRKGRLLAAQMHQMARDLDLFDARPHVSQLECAKNVTAWALYLLQSTMSLAMQTPKVFGTCRPAAPPQACGRCGHDDWRAYPDASGTPMSGHLDCVRQQYASMACLGSDIAEALFGDAKAASQHDVRQKADALCGVVDAWRRQWPSCLEVDGKTLPHIMLLHMHYFYHIAYISVALYEQARHDQTMGAAEPLRQRALEAAFRTSALVDEYERHWTLGTVHVLTAHLCQVLAIVLLRVGVEDLESPTAFESLSRVVRAFSTRWELGLGMQLQIASLEVPRLEAGTLPPQTARLVHRMQQEAELACASNSVIFNSAYPSFSAALTAKDPSETALDRVLELCKDMQIDGHDKG